MDDPISAKAALRSEMRAMRKGLPDRVERSTEIWRHVEAMAVVQAAAVVMVFEAIPGEPLTGPFVDWCRSEGKRVVFPEDDPPRVEVDVVIVPGLAFTPAGDRLGQGGGWYDRFLAGVREECVTIGVGFAPQLREWLPTERHDVRVDAVVTERGAGRTDGLE